MTDPTEGTTRITQNATTILRNWRLLGLALVPFSACVTNKSSDPRLASVMHQCFQTTDDALLYQTPYCPSLTGVTSTSTCITVQYLNSFYPPVTLKDFNTSARAEEDVMHELRRPGENGHGVFTPSVDTIRVLGALVWPTSFTIESMRRYSNPEEGGYWIVTVKIRDGQFAGQQITLPWSAFMHPSQAFGGWITDSLQRQPFAHDAYRPQIDSTKMVPREPSGK
jgi:hypothetical protein